MIFETDNTIDPEDLCHHCHKNPIGKSDDEIYLDLCSDCYDEYCEAMGDTASDVDLEDNPQKKDALIEETGAEFGVSAEKSKEWYFDTYIAPELSNDEEDDEDEDSDDDEDDMDDDEEEEEDLLADHYGEDLTREEREEIMLKDIEKAQDKE